MNRTNDCQLLFGAPPNQVIPHPQHTQAQYLSSFSAGEGAYFCAGLSQYNYSFSNCSDFLSVCAYSCLNGHHVDPIARKALKSLSPSRVCPELMIVPKCIFFPQDHPKIKPKSIHSPDLVDSFAEDYMYLSCIKFINEVSHSLMMHSSSLPNRTSSLLNIIFAK